MNLEEKMLQIEKKIDTLLNESVAPAMEDVKIMDNMGRITIPKAFRKVLDVDSAAEFKIMLVGNEIILKKVVDK